MLWAPHPDFPRLPPPCSQPQLPSGSPPFQTILPEPMPPTGLVAVGGLSPHRGKQPLLSRLVHRWEAEVEQVRSPDPSLHPGRAHPASQLPSVP